MLQKSGVKVMHENNGLDGSVSCLFAVDDFWYHGRHKNGRRSRFTYDHVWHQVRHPLKAIASIHQLARQTPWFWHWQSKHTGIDWEEPFAENVGRFWVQWNLWCEDQADMTYRAEDLPWREMARRLGIDAEAPPHVNPSETRKPKPEISWSDLGRAEEPVRKMASRYGYDA